MTIPTVTLPHPDAEHYVLPDGRPLARVTSVLREAGLADFSATWFTEDVRTRGTLVHQAIALLVEQDLDWDTLDPVLVPYVQAFEAWRDAGAFIVEAAELRVCDPALGYAGTIDLLAKRWQANTWVHYVVDIKCGVVPPTVGPQLAAYARCLHDTWRFRACLNLRDDGSYRFEPLDDPEDEDDFLAALRLFHRKRSRYGTR